MDWGLQTAAAVANGSAAVPWWQWRRDNGVLLVPIEALFGLLLDIWEGEGRSRGIFWVFCVCLVVLSLVGGGGLAATTMAVVANDGGDGEERKGDEMSVTVCCSDSNGGSSDDGVDAIILILLFLKVSM
eukprot:7129190-Ditylum_brightwellii.AAC.1